MEQLQLRYKPTCIACMCSQHANNYVLCIVAIISGVARMNLLVWLRVFATHVEALKRYL